MSAPPYILGTAYARIRIRDGPNFHRVIGDESTAVKSSNTKSVCPIYCRVRRRRLERHRTLLIRSSKMASVKLVRVEAGGEGINPNRMQRIPGRSLGVLKARARLLQDESARSNDDSRERRPDYAAVGPNTRFCAIKTFEYLRRTDEKALAAFMKLARLEAYPRARKRHAVPEAIVRAPKWPRTNSSS